MSQLTTSRPASISRFATTTGSALPDWMDTPEKRRRIWAWQAIAAAFVGNVEWMEECEKHARREDANCKLPLVQNDQALRRRNGE